jgi:hypothetical protein
MAQQTAVEFLLSELDIAKLIEREKLTMAAEVVRQAKAMEKEQIEDAFQSGKWNGYESAKDISEMKDPTEYYNETYGK